MDTTEGKQKKIKKRRFLGSDYDFIGNYITEELDKRKTLDERKSHEALWREVDRQVHMKSLEVISTDPEDSWKSALELGDLSTASEVLAADALRLIFPQDRSWLNVHTKIDFERLAPRFELAQGQELSEKKKSKIQRQSDGELRALMTQQHMDFGLKTRVGLSIKEALHHGSFVAEVRWEEMSQYATGGAIKSASAPVWTPHSMWNCYPETGDLSTNLIYTGSMMIEWQKDYNWVMRQTEFINLTKLKNKTTNTKEPINLITYFGDITVERKGEPIFLPNMKIVVSDKVVLYAKPMDNVSIIYGGYDRVDVRDPYYMSPIVKQSPNHKISTIIANKFLDNVELKLDPPIVYDGNDATLIKQGGVRVIPGHQTPSKGGAQNFKQVDIGDPSWAANAIKFFKGEIQEGTGVSSSRAGAQRQADRVTATQIEQESQGAEVRTIDFVGKIEKGLKVFLYIQHDLNKKRMGKYTFYNPEMGMKDFEELTKSDLPQEVHFEIVGSKGVITERRRSQATNEVTTFLMSNPITADLVNEVEVAKQMYMDAGNKNPERLLKVSDENSQMKRAIAQVQEKAQQVIEEMQQKSQEIGQKLVSTELELKNAQDQLKLRNERANGTETALRDQIVMLKANAKQQMEFMRSLMELKNEKDEIEDMQKDMDHKMEMKGKMDMDGKMEKKEQSPPVVVNIKPTGYKFNRDENGDMTEALPIDDDDKVENV